MRVSYYGVLALLISTSALHAQNRLVNGGFETGNFTGWTISGQTGANAFVSKAGVPIPGTDFGPSASLVRSGMYSASTIVCCDDFNDTPQVTRLTQTIALQPGAQYTVGFWMANASPTIFIGFPTGNAFTQIFVNGNGLLGGDNIFGDTLTFINFSSTFNSGNNISATITFQLSGSGTGRAAISADDFYVNEPFAVLPEPSTLVLVSAGLGWVTVLLKRRKRSTAHDLNSHSAPYAQT